MTYELQDEPEPTPDEVDAAMRLSRLQARPDLTRPREDEGVYCIKCGYDLRGLPGPTCPECGKPFDPNDRWTTRRDPRKRGEYGRWPAPTRLVGAVTVFIVMLVMQAVSLPCLAVAPCGMGYVIPIALTSFLVLTIMGERWICDLLPLVSYGALIGAVGQLTLILLAALAMLVAGGSAAGLPSISVSFAMFVVAGGGAFGALGGLVRAWVSS